MQKLRVGPCPLCKKNIFRFKMPKLIEWDANGGRINWKKRPVEMNADGTHFWILQTDSSRMAVAICKECLKNLKEEDVKKIFADIIYTKLDRIKGNTNKDYSLFNHIRTIDAYKWFYSEKEVVEYLAEMEGADAKNNCS